MIMTKINKTILIADDDFDFLFQMKFKLESAGFNTVSASSQKEAEYIIINSDFDAAVLDLMMESDDSGFVLAYKIKKKNATIPVIITTAVAAETGLSFGNETSWVKADLYLEKGIESDKLIDGLKTLLKI